MTSNSAPTKTLPEPHQPTAAPLPSLPNRRMKMMIYLTLGILLIGLIWFLLWFFHFRYYQWTDDAYVNGDMINVTPVVSGVPIAFYADDTDLVEEGQLLVMLDSTDYQINYDRELAMLASTTLQVKQIYDRINEAQANVNAQKTSFEQARYDFENRKGLINSKAISNEDFVHARDALSISEQRFKQAQAQLQQAMAAAGPTDIAKHPSIEAQKNAVRDAYYKLKHCAVLAPATGYIAQRAVQIGQYVSQQSYLMAIIPANRMWVDANYKETQLTYMRVGQPARVTVDLYGSDVIYKGVVVGISSGTGSVFSVIPAQNATGNWIKIVQRLPVRIALDSKELTKYPLRLGLSVETNVDITQTDLPIMASTPSKSPIATTKVLDLDLVHLEAIMNEIIQDNVMQAQQS